MYLGQCWCNFKHDPSPYLSQHLAGVQDFQAGQSPIWPIVSNQFVAQWTGFCSSIRQGVEFNIQRIYFGIVVNQDSDNDSFIWLVSKDSVNRFEGINLW